MSEFERRDRLEREPTVDDVRQLVAASTPHFALHIRNRIRNLIAGLPEEHPARAYGERELARMEQLGYEGERRGHQGDGEPGLPSIRLGDADAN